MPELTLEEITVKIPATKACRAKIRRLAALLSAAHGVSASPKPAPELIWVSYRIPLLTDVSAIKFQTIAESTRRACREAGLRASHQVTVENRQTFARARFYIPDTVEDRYSLECKIVAFRIANGMLTRKARRGELLDKPVGRPRNKRP